MQISGPFFFSVLYMIRRTWLMRINKSQINGAFDGKKLDSRYIETVRKKSRMISWSAITRKKFYSIASSANKLPMTNIQLIIYIKIYIILPWPGITPSAVWSAKINEWNIIWTYEFQPAKLDMLSQAVRKFGLLHSRFVDNTLQKKLIYKHSFNIHFTY